MLLVHRLWGRQCKEQQRSVRCAWKLWMGTCFSAPQGTGFIGSVRKGGRAGSPGRVPHAEAMSLSGRRGMAKTADDALSLTIHEDLEEVTEEVALEDQEELVARTRSPRTLMVPLVPDRSLTPSTTISNQPAFQKAMVRRWIQK